jgi:hypothetical protein
LGLVVTASYYLVLAPKKLLGLGKPADIGGGLVPLGGLTLMAVGSVVFLASLVGSRRRRE